MKITADEVRRVAALARLELSPDDEQLLTSQLDKILQYVDKLNKVDTDKVEPLAHVIDIVNAFRDDRATSRPSPDDLLANAPEKEKDFLKVPKIIE